MANVLIVTGTAKYYSAPSGTSPLVADANLKYTLTKIVRIPLTITFPSLPALPSLVPPLPPFPALVPPLPKITFPKLPSFPNLNLGRPKYGNSQSSGLPEAQVVVTTSSKTE